MTDRPGCPGGAAAAGVEEFSTTNLAPFFCLIWLLSSQHMPRMRQPLSPLSSDERAERTTKLEVLKYHKPANQWYQSTRTLLPASLVCVSHSLLFHLRRAFCRPLVPLVRLV